MLWYYWFLFIGIASGITAISASWVSDTIFDIVERDSLFFQIKDALILISVFCLDMGAIVLLYKFFVGISH